jgi:hypothetical protein
VSLRDEEVYVSSSEQDSDDDSSYLSDDKMKLMEEMIHRRPNMIYPHILDWKGATLPHNKPDPSQTLPTNTELPTSIHLIQDRHENILGSEHSSRDSESVAADEDSCTTSECSYDEDSSSNDISNVSEYADLVEELYFKKE